MTKTLTQVLQLIQDDILSVLKDNKGKAMTQDQLFKKRKLMNYSEYGWSFALEKLEKKNLIKISGFIYDGEILYIAV